MDINFNIVLCGFMACGKTTVGKKLSILTGLRFIDTDDYIEEKTGLSINEIFNRYGEKYFRDIEKNCITEISKKNGYIISTGGGVVLNKDNILELKKNGKIIYLNTSFNIISLRLSHDSKRPLIKNADIKSIKELFDRRREKYLSAADIVINGDLDINIMCNKIISEIKKASHKP